MPATITIAIPELHAAQAVIYRQRTRRNVLRCGRRFGKDVFQNTIACDRAIKGRRVGLFAPEYKQLVEPFDAIANILRPIEKRANRGETIHTKTGGIVDFWYVNDNELAGRGREYDDVFINEAAFTKANMQAEIWQKAISPTLLVRRGTAWVMSTPAGIDPSNFFYACCNDQKLGFKEFHAPTSANPLITAEDLEFERRTKPPLVYQQEYLAEFVDWSGAAFFSRDKFLDQNGAAFPFPGRCDGVFAVMDTAVKTRSDNDGTGVTYFARTKHGAVPLTVLDWELTQIEGALLEAWLPNVYRRLDELGRLCGARFGSLGVFIEDKASGSILLQQARRRGWPATPIDSKLTAVGKDERAISVSGYHYQGLIKITQHAFDKITNYKGVERNHFLTQVVNFRIGDKDGSREDDLLDTYCYGVAISLGDGQGF